jgi:predicted Rossmann fold flavoprotein
VIYDVAVLGGGASALMFASWKNESSVVIIEGEEKCAKKLLVSGGGRCNITNINVTSDNYLGDHHFIVPALKNFDNHALLSWLKKRGLIPVIREEKFYFCKESAKEIISLLFKASKKVPKLTNHRILSVEKREHFEIKTSQGVIYAKKVVVASGGLSFPKIGASGIGYEIAKSFGHRVKTPKPALVGLTLQPPEFWMKALSGIAFEVETSVGEKKCSGNLLFAHKGISGPVILDSSIYWEKGSFSIDFVPKVHLKKLFTQSNKNFSTQVPLPKRFVKAFLEAIAVADKPIRQYSEAEREKLKTIKQYVMSPSGNFGYAKAEVTKGGIMSDEINPDTFESKKCQGLYFIGEVLDVTGELGGYNFQWAFSSAVKCAKSL